MWFYALSLDNVNGVERRPATIFFRLDPGVTPGDESARVARNVVDGLAGDLNLKLGSVKTVADKVQVALDAQAEMMLSANFLAFALKVLLPFANFHRGKDNLYGDCFGLKTHISS